MSTNNAASLFGTAEELGELSSDSKTLLDPLQTEINAALAGGPKKRAARVILVTFNLDNSPSMTHKATRNGPSNFELGFEGHDLFFDALVGCKAAKQILALSGWMNPFDQNNGLYFPFRDLVQPAHTSKTPKPNFVRMVGVADKERTLGGTPLCTTMLRTLGAVQAQTTDYTQDGSDVFTITVFLTDGGNNDIDHFPTEVATLVADMRRQERHKIYLGGIDDGYTDYVAFGVACGLDPACVRKMPNDPKEIRAWVELVSQSAVAGSEAADLNAFSQIKLS